MVVLTSETSNYVFISIAICVLFEGLTVPTQETVGLSVSETEVLVLLSQVLVVLDLLPALADLLHDLLGTQVVALFDFFSLLLTEKYVGR